MGSRARLHLRVYVHACAFENVCMCASVCAHVCAFVSVSLHACARSCVHHACARACVHVLVRVGRWVDVGHACACMSACFFSVGACMCAFTCVYVIRVCASACTHTCVCIAHSCVCICVRARSHDRVSAIAREHAPPGKHTLPIVLPRSPPVLTLLRSHPSVPSLRPIPPSHPLVAYLRHIFPAPASAPVRCVPSQNLNWSPDIPPPTRAQRDAAEAPESPGGGGERRAEDGGGGVGRVGVGEQGPAVGCRVELE